MKLHRLLVVFCLLYALIIPAGYAQDEDLRQEEAEDYYDKWLNEDVVYIITAEERGVFESLSTPEEKEQFIEQFWFRRDPDPRTAENEFKAEHYRRIAYANERFGSGLLGWQTDRGRIYIIHGPPTEIEQHAAGGTYHRPLNEGGGSTATFPFEIWRYRHIPGVGDNVLLEFVDPSMSGEYRLALRPEEKDALLFVPGAGKTLAEEMGLAHRSDRPFFSPEITDGYPMMLQTAKDDPFYKYDVYTTVQKPQSIEYQDLKEMVEVNVSYSSLPMKVHEDYFRLNSDQVLVPVTVELENKELNFEMERGSHVARLALYGLVTNLSNRLVTEFEDDFVASFGQDNLTQGLQSRSIYQKVLVLDRRQRYKLDLAVQDQVGEKVGVVRKAIIPPSFDEEKMSASSVLLSDSIRVLEEATDPDEMFVIGDVKIRPRIDGVFPVGSPVAVYVQLYGVSLDQSTGKPSLKIKYSLLDEQGKVLRSQTDEVGESVQYFSERRVVLARRFSMRGLSANKYRLQLSIVDQLDGDEVTLTEEVTLVPQS